MLHRVNGRPNASGRVLAVATMNVSSSGLIRRGRPPAHRGSRLAMPISLNRWMTWRIVSSSACTSRAIDGTVFPPAHASTTPARRNRIGEPDTPAGDTQQLLTLLITQPPHAYRICHHHSLNATTP